MMATLDVELEIVPRRAAADTPLDIRGAVRNTGTSVIDTNVEMSNLLVDGTPSETWAWAMNGPRDERAFALPPGERYEFSRILPSSILPRPGRHDLVLEVQGVRSPAVTVERSAS